MRISDWSSDVCSSDLLLAPIGPVEVGEGGEESAEQVASSGEGRLVAAALIDRQSRLYPLALRPQPFAAAGKHAAIGIPPLEGDEAGFAAAIDPLLPSPVVERQHRLGRAGIAGQQGQAMQQPGQFEEVAWPPTAAGPLPAVLR